VGIVIGLARRHAYGHAMVALVVPPLAAWWGWRAGLRRTTLVWGAALALYTMGAVILAVTRT
jgi:nitrate/nitrite transporter NarK